MNSSTLSVVIATYHGEHYIRPLLDSITAQSRQPDEIIVIDNSPNQKTSDIIKSSYPNVILEEQTENLDFAKGYNRGMEQSSGDLILILNQDMVLQENAIEELIATSNTDGKIGAIAPTLLRMLPNGEKTNTVDGLGIATNRSRRFINIGEGKNKSDVVPQEPFGLSGAAILFTRAALNDLALHGGGGPNEFFDNQFIAYKEDADLSYRLHHRGWKITVAEKAIIYHHRTAQELEATTSVFAARKKKSERVRVNSLRNHWWVLLKNEPWVNLLLHAPFILWYEARKALFVLLFEPSSWKVFTQFFAGLPAILKKRKAILSSSVLSRSELRSKLRS